MGIQNQGFLNQVPSLDPKGMDPIAMDAKPNRDSASCSVTGVSDLHHPVSRRRATCTYTYVYIYIYIVDYCCTNMYIYIYMYM